MQKPHEILLPDCNRTGGKISKKEYTKWLDYDTIKSTLQLRGRNPGDYLTIAPGCGKKKLKQYFIDAKIPAEERDRIPLLTDGSHVLWVVGGRISEACKITDQTKRVLKVQIREDDNGICPDGA